jgi:hypothetical protein
MEQLGIGSAKAIIITIGVIVLVVYVIMHVDALREFVGLPPAAA